MELNLVFMCTTIGALVGTSIGVLMMNRKIRLPITAGDLDVMRNKLQTTEASLAEANTSLEDLRKQIAERDQAVRQHGEDLKKKQADLELAGAEAEKDKVQRSTAELKLQELSIQAAALKEQRAELEAKLDDERSMGVEKFARLTSMEAQLEACRLQNQELTEQVDSLKSDTAALNRFREQESRHRSSLETALNVEQERVQQLTNQIAELEGDRSRLHSKVQEERQSAARGMELLLMAQENFSRVFKQAPNEGHENGHVVVRAAGTSLEMHPDPEVLQSTLGRE